MKPTKIYIIKQVKASEGNKINMALIEHIGFYDNRSKFHEHTHLYCEMIFVIDGEITISSGDTDYAVTTGDICLIPSEIPHRTDVYPNRYKRWLLFINPWDFAKIYSSPMLQGMLSGLLIKEPILFHIGKSGKQLFSEMSKELNDKSVFGDDIVSSGVIYLLSQLGRNNIDIFKELSQSEKTVMTVQNYIQQNYNQPLNMEEVADRFFINKFYLTHIFSKHTGISPKKFQIRCRLENAERLVRTTELSISEISEQCGFISLSDLTGRFKIKYGVTPAIYRKQRMNEYGL